MGLGTNYDQQGCYLARALEVIGERWTLLIIRDCCFGVRHFNDFLGHLDISRAVLTDRLATLVDAGVLARRPSGRSIEYVLTAAGEELWPMIYGLYYWASEHLTTEHPARSFTHADCGAELDSLARCPACGLVPALSDVMTRPGTGRDPMRRDDLVARALAQPRRMLTPLP